MNYGLPYKGSKNKLAERIVALLPERKHLIDLFCGGCAVSHAALVKGKYEHIHINDLNWMCPTLFMDALAGKYDDERRWISHEDFARLKDTDPYVAVVWSFGNNLCTYMYSREIEPLKRAIHYAIFFSDYEPGRELGHDLSFIDGAKEVSARYAMVRKYFKQFDGGQIGDSRAMGKRPSETQHVERLRNVLNLYGGGKSERMQNIEANCRIASDLGRWRQWNAERDQSSTQKKKNAECSVPTRCRTWNVGSGSTRLQHRERLHAVEQIRGGAERTADYKQCA